MEELIINIFKSLYRQVNEIMRRLVSILLILLCEPKGLYKIESVTTYTKDVN